jgi:hypothetical protein
LKSHFPSLEDDYIAQGRWRTVGLDDKKRASTAPARLERDPARLADAIEQKMLNDILAGSVCRGEKRRPPHVRP